MNMMMKEEMLDEVDLLDRVVVARPRSEIHRLGLRHRAVHVLVFNRRGELFLQKRSMSKDSNPGLWDTSCAGHVDSGEDYDDCAVRELSEELGVSCQRSPEQLFRLCANAKTGMEFCWVYRLDHDGPFELQAEEIDEGRWCSAVELERWIAERPEELTSSLKLIWRRLTSE